MPATGGVFYYVILALIAATRLIAWIFKALFGAGKSAPVRIGAGLVCLFIWSLIAGSLHPVVAAIIPIVFIGLMWASRTRATRHAQQPQPVSGTRRPAPPASRPVVEQPQPVPASAPASQPISTIDQPYTSRPPRFQRFYHPGTPTTPSATREHPS